jgi:hypothetical protein
VGTQRVTLSNQNMFYNDECNILLNYYTVNRNGVAQKKSG